MKRIALIGMPNTGKSTLFNRLTGAHAKVGNWPGITVELLAAKILIGGDMVQVVDLPGIYDLRAHSSDEAVVTAFLAQDAADLAIVVLNASQIERQITLLGQLARPGLRVILVLNMADEAATLGITIDRERLSSDLGVPVCLISAKYGQGVEQLHALITAALRGEKASGPVLASGERLTEELLDAAIRRSVMVPAHASHALTEKIDRVLLHPWLGLPIFFVLMFLLVQAVFFVGKPIPDAMGGAPMKTTNPGSPAEHSERGITSMVRSRRPRERMTRVPMSAGTLQPNPIRIMTKLRPSRPNFDISASIRNAARDR